MKITYKTKPIEAIEKTADIKLPLYFYSAKEERYIMYYENTDTLKDIYPFRVMEMFFHKGLLIAIGNWTRMEQELGNLIEDDNYALMSENHFNNAIDMATRSLQKMKSGYAKCNSCDGYGEHKHTLSDCCGVSPRGNGDCDTSDFGICAECGDHCDYSNKCPDCNGTGEKKQLTLK